MISPSSIHMPLSPGFDAGSLSSSPPRMLMPAGMHIESICLPVQSGRGLMMAGVGITPSQPVRRVSVKVATGLKSAGETHQAPRGGYSEQSRDP